MGKEHIIREAEIEESESKEEKLKKTTIFSGNAVRVKKNWRIDWVLLFVLGILIGIAAKQEAGKRIVIGFDDYRMKFGDQNYSINLLEKELRANPDKQRPSLGSLSGGGNCQQQ